jgi:hypothetical protein
MIGISKRRNPLDKTAKVVIEACSAQSKPDGGRTPYISRSRHVPEQTAKLRFAAKSAYPDLFYGGRSNLFADAKTAEYPV